MPTAYFFKPTMEKMSENIGSFSFGVFLSIPTYITSGEIMKVVIVSIVGGLISAVIRMAFDFLKDWIKK